LQKSLQGLKRSLLHATLKAIPDLIPEVFPQFWSELNSRSTLIGSFINMNLDDSEVNGGFFRLMNHDTIFEHKRLCFFIDGLDEYEGRLQEDTKHLVELLCYWTRTHQDSIKLCVSSREYNVFMNAFSPQQRLRLHQLTRRDMERYARDKLTHIHSNPDQDLANLITEKAEGIFLWVALVVKRMREQWEDGANFDDLVRDLDLLPQELEDLFHHILMSLSPWDRKKAYQTFAIVTSAEKYHVKLSLFAYSFLEQFNANPDFAIEQDLELLWTFDSGTSICQTTEDTARKRLNGTCKGLVELVAKRPSALSDLPPPPPFRPPRPPPRTFRPPRPRSPPPTDFSEPGGAWLTFTHRSVPEFLHSQTIKENMDSTLQSFLAEEALSQLLLAEMQRGKSQSMTIETSSAHVYSITRMRMDKRLDVSPYTFLEKLSDAAMKLTHERRTAVERSGAYPSVGVRIINPFSTDGGAFVIAKDAEIDLIVLNSPLHIGAYIGHNNYVDFKVTHDSTATDTHNKIDLLFLCIQEKFFSFSASSQELHLIDLLHHKGLRVNQPTPFRPPPFSEFSRKSNWQFTMWTYTIVRLIKIMEKYGPCRERYVPLAQLIERLMEMGADRHIWIETSPNLAMPMAQQDCGPKAPLGPLKHGGRAERKPITPQSSLKAQTNQQQSQISSTALRDADVYLSDDGSLVEIPSLDTDKSTLNLIPAFSVLRSLALRRVEVRRDKEQCTLITLESPLQIKKISLDRTPPISLHELFQVWNPPNIARLLELLEEDVKVTTGESWQASKSPPLTKPDYSAVGPINQRSEQASAQGLRINGTKFIESQALDTKTEVDRSESINHKPVTETSTPMGVALTSKMFTLFFVLSKSEIQIKISHLLTSLGILAALIVARQWSTTVF
jgi:hypothetical protein